MHASLAFVVATSLLCFKFILGSDFEGNKENENEIGSFDIQIPDLACTTPSSSVSPRRRVRRRRGREVLPQSTEDSSVPESPYRPLQTSAQSSPPIILKRVPVEDSPRKFRAVMELFMELYSLQSYELMNKLKAVKTFDWYSVVPSSYHFKVENKVNIIAFDINATQPKQAKNKRPQTEKDDPSSNLWAIMLFVRNRSIHRSDYKDASYEKLYRDLVLTINNADDNVRVIKYSKMTRDKVDVIEDILRVVKTCTGFGNVVSRFEEIYYEPIADIPCSLLCDREDGIKRDLKGRAFGLMILEVYSVAPSCFFTVISKTKTVAWKDEVHLKNGDNRSIFDSFKKNMGSVLDFVRHRYAHASNYGATFLDVEELVSQPLERAGVNLLNTLRAMAKSKSRAKWSAVVEAVNYYDEYISFFELPVQQNLPSLSDVGLSADDSTSTTMISANESILILQVPELEASPLPVPLLTYCEESVELPITEVAEKEISENTQSNTVSEIVNTTMVDTEDSADCKEAKQAAHESPVQLNSPVELLRRSATTSSNPQVENGTFNLNALDFVPTNLKPSATTKVGEEVHLTLVPSNSEDYLDESNAFEAFPEYEEEMTVENDWMYYVSDFYEEEGFFDDHLSYEGLIAPPMPAQDNPHCSSTYSPEKTPQSSPKRKRELKPDTAHNDSNNHPSPKKAKLFNITHATPETPNVFQNVAPSELDFLDQFRNASLNSPKKPTPPRSPKKRNTRTSRNLFANSSPVSPSSSFNQASPLPYNPPLFNQTSPPQFNHTSPSMQPQPYYHPVPHTSPHQFNQASSPIQPSPPNLYPVSGHQPPVHQNYPFGYGSSFAPQSPGFSQFPQGMYPQSYQHPHMSPPSSHYPNSPYYPGYAPTQNGRYNH